MTRTIALQTNGVRSKCIFITSVVVLDRLVTRLIGVHGRGPAYVRLRSTILVRTAVHALTIRDVASCFDECLNCLRVIDGRPGRATAFLHFLSCYRRVNELEH